MLQKEAEEFLVDVAWVAFPAARAFVVTNSSSPKKTVEFEAKALLAIDYQEAVSVIDRWTTGSLPPPSGREFNDGFALHIRAVVMNDRSKFIRKQPLEELRQNRRDYKSVNPAAPYYARIQIEGERFKNGEITRDSYDRFCSDVLREHDEDFKKMRRREFAEVA
jgi:hypothetical protein